MTNLEITDANGTVHSVPAVVDQYATGIIMVGINADGTAGTLPSHVGTRLATDFLSSAARHAIEGDFGMFAASLRLAAEFATQAATELREERARLANQAYLNTL